MDHTTAIAAALLLGLGAAADAAAENTSFKTNSGQLAFVELSAANTQVIRGQDVTLLWTAVLANNCQAAGDWQGAKASKDNETIRAVTQGGRYELECKVQREPGTAARYVSASVDVEVIDPKEVNVSLSASATAVAPGDSVTLSWQADNASQCTASGDWLGPQPTSGTETISRIDGNRTFTLSCGTGSSSALATVTVASNAPKLQWLAPETDVNGEPLTTLTGYRIYWGTEPGVYTNFAEVEDPSATEWYIAAVPGDYYFAVSAIAQNEESALSNEIRRTVPKGSLSPDPVFEVIAQTASADNPAG